MPHKPTLLVLVLGLAGAALGASIQTPPPAGQQPPAQQSEIELSITGEPGAPPRYAVPDFIALSPDPETAAGAKTIASVLWEDLGFEREFYLIPRDTYASIPPARSLSDVPFDRWRELGADGLVIGTVQKTANGIRLEVRLFNVRSRQSVFDREYSGPASNPRFFAHTVSDEVHQQQRALRGVARTKLTFSSDRDGERVQGTVERREVKEVYIADYDGANQRRVTVNRALNIMPTWSPDARSIAYTSYRRGYPDIYVSLIYQGTLQTPMAASGTQNWLPAWSPDGTRIAFTSSRDGNPELYVANRDGSNIRRITNNPAIDTTPTWSPTGAQIAFTTDRTGSPQIYVMGADGLNLRRVTSESVLRPRHLVTCPVQRARVRVPDGAGVRHQDLRLRQRRDAADHVRRRQQREPELFAERAAPRLYVDACRQDAGVHDRPRRQGPAAGHEGRKQLHP